MATVLYLLEKYLKVEVHEMLECQMNVMYIFYVDSTILSILQAYY